ncbi:MAG: tetratricopeptide repeat protein, partial [Anaerolineae bacterium]
ADKRPAGTRDIDSPWGGGVGVENPDFSVNIPDQELRELAHKLVVESNKLVHINARWLTVLADYFQTPVFSSLEEQFAFSRKINRHRRKHGASWISEPHIQELLQETQSEIKAIETLKLPIEERLEEVYGHLIITHEEFGDQRASDLVDKADGVPDSNPKKAIKLLQKALKYGETGIQASKAYLGLGMRYEDLGKIDKAIEFYTKSMDALEPFSIALFWRGQLYYEQEQWDKAQSDFEQALSPENGELDSMNRKEAEDYLAKLKMMKDS